MIGTSKPALRITGSGNQLRLRVAAGPDSLAMVRECCRASTAVDKALGEAIRQARTDGHAWTEVGEALSTRQAQTGDQVLEGYSAAKRSMWRLFWDLEEGRP